jgi:predicted transposase YbfD/YdcC
LPRARLALLMEHFSVLSGEREPQRIMYPLKEVLLLVTCATIASCDDFDDIAAWGKHHLSFLRRFSEFHFGIPCERWLRILVNRVDPLLFGRCFDSWIAALWPDRHDLIAIDGKTSRRSHDRGKGLKALHTISAYATRARLTLAQLSVPEKTNEITAIPELLDQLAEAGQLKGALVTIDAMGCQVDIADKIVAHKADCSFETRYFIVSAPCDIERLAAAARGHWGVESMHWLLDVEFKDDLSRYRAGHGAKNMATIRRFALGLVRANKAKGSVKTKRKSAGWNPDFLLHILQIK